MASLPPLQIGGLASGLDTASIISQLMAAEAAPQTMLKDKRTAEQAQVSALQQINTALASLSTAAASFQTGSTWSQLSATSSSSAVTVTASSSASPTNLAVTVLSTAAPAQLTYAGTATAADAVVATPTGDPTRDVLSIGLPDGSNAQVAIGDGKLSTIVANLNALTGADGKPLVHASAVSVGAGKYGLLVTSATNAVGSLSITDPNGDAFFDPANAQQRAGSLASLSIGPGLTVTSATNTFTGVLPGVDLTIGADAAAGTTAQLSITDDGSSRATAVKAFVGQINDLLSSIGTQTAYGSVGSDGTTTGAGALAGNADLRSLADQLLDTVVRGDSKLGEYGLSVDRYGQLTFDADTFTAAYAQDPQGVQQAFQDGFSQAVKTVADSASDPYDGWLTASISGQNDEISGLSDQISAWDDRLAVRQASLEQIYTNLETTLAALQTQQSWLAAQLDSLDSLSSSSSKS